MGKEEVQVPNEKEKAGDILLNINAMIRTLALRGIRRVKDNIVTADDLCWVLDETTRLNRACIEELIIKGKPDLEELACDMGSSNPSQENLLIEFFCDNKVPPIKGDVSYFNPLYVQDVSYRETRIPGLYLEIRVPKEQGSVLMREVMFVGEKNTCFKPLKES